jgi:hypothetical protein
MKPLISITAFAIAAVVLQGCASQNRGLPMLPANGQDGPHATSAQASPAPVCPTERVDVLSVVMGGMLAPKVAYSSFNKFLCDKLSSFTKGGGTVRTEYVFTGPHVFRLWSHAARVKDGNEEAFSDSTKGKGSRTMRKLIDPFLADNPGGRIVLGGHSYGSVEMQCLKEMVEKKYGKQVIAAAYVLAPVVRRVDSDVAVVSARHDCVVPFSDFLYPGRAVRGTPTTVPGLDHFMIQDSPEARTVLAKHFTLISSHQQYSAEKHE